MATRSKSTPARKRAGRFRNLSDRPDALLMAIIGGPDAGKVDWHPSVVTEARATGLSVDDDGNLIVEKTAE